MSSLIISSASRSSPRIFIYHSSHIILIPSSFHSIILAFFTFPLIHFTMVLFAISSKLIFTHLSYALIHHSYLLSFLFHLHHPHHHWYLLFILIRFYGLYSSISIHFHLIISFSHFNLTHYFPFPFQYSHSIPFHHFHSFTCPYLTLHSCAFNNALLFINRHSFISSISILIPLFSILHFPFISFLRFTSSFLNYEIYTMSVRIVVIACSFVVLIGNTLSQLEVTAFASDGWFESSRIEWWGNGRMSTWGLEGIGVNEAQPTEVYSIGW